METSKRLKRSTALLVAAILLFAGCVTVKAQTTTVWPGDINNNGGVNHVDLLYLGLRLGESGTDRDSVSINWTGHGATLWEPLGSLPDPCYADCNGDSTVELSDRIAIDVNFGLDRGFTLPDSSSLNRGTVENAPLEFEFDNDPIVSGNLDTIDIILGTPDEPVDALLGFATTITFDTALVDSAWLFVGDSWLGVEGVNLAAIDHYEDGLLKIALTRTDTIDVLQGNGRVAGVVIAMVDDLKKEVEIDSTSFEFTDALGMSKDFSIASFRVSQGSAKVFSTSFPLDALIYPVPASDELNITMLDSPEKEIECTLYDFGGRLVRKETMGAGNHRIERNGLRAGIYYLQLKSGDSWLRKRIVFAD